MTDYVELHAHSVFSLLDGASSPDNLAARAADLRMPALALTDHDAVYGAVRFASAAQALGVRPLFGAELTLEDDTHLTLLVQNQTGWHNLGGLISRARQNAPKGEAALPLHALEGHTDGLIALSGCRKGVVTAALLRGDREAALNAGERLVRLFGRERTWLELQRHLLPGETALLAAQADLAEHLGVGIVATNNVHYATRAGHQLQDVLVCIRHLTTLTESARLRRPNSEFYLKSTRRLRPLFADYPEALTNTLRIAEQCDFDLQYGLQDLPQHPTPAGMSAAAYLSHLCKGALPARYGDAPAGVRERLAYELSVIDRAGLSNYFLVVWDIVRWAGEQGIRCQGRGSAANSLAAYLLGITPIDPLAHDLVFERFLSDERALAPDIDIDFDAARREEVIQYIYERYGADHTAMACTFVTFRARSALRDVGRVLAIPAELLDEVAVSMKGNYGEDIPGADEAEETVGGRFAGPLFETLLDLTRQIQGYPRHLGIHNGGMVITGPPITARVPTEPATMPDRVVVQWDKEALEDAGLVKIDILGLRMLSALSEAESLIEAAIRQRPILDALTFDDPAVYEVIARADTVGMFQVESRAQAQMLPRLRPTCFEDLIVAISLIRPGPIQGNMVHPYLRRRNGEESVSYAHPRLEPILAETLGVVLFQEQVLKVARDIAGFTPGQGEILRRGLGYKNGREIVEGLHDAFVTGAARRDIPLATAETIFDMLRAFGGYSLPKSHAAAFAVIAYQSAWLKIYHPAAFFAALLNNQPMGFWSPAVLVNDAKRHGVRTRPIDVNVSAGRCTVAGPDVRLGFGQVRGFGEAGVERLLAARGDMPFRDLSDLCRRSGLPRRLIENLILSGACDGWDVPCRRLLWELGRLRYDELPLDYADGAVDLPPPSAFERLGMEIDTVGVTTSTHPAALYREAWTTDGVLTSPEVRGCPDGDWVRFGGLVVMHQAPPTAKGLRFLTLEDEFGLVDVIVRPPVYEHYRRVIRGASLILVGGRLQHANGVVSLIARWVQAL